MSTPPGQKELWRNCVWKDDKEKLAFFNHYFKDSDIVANHMRTTLDSFKGRLISYIQEGKIKEGIKERDITLQDVVAEIRRS